MSFSVLGNQVAARMSFLPRSCTMNLCCGAILSRPNYGELLCPRGTKWCVHTVSTSQLLVGGDVEYLCRIVIIDKTIMDCVTVCTILSPICLWDMPLWTSLKMFARRQRWFSIKPYMLSRMICTSLLCKQNWLAFFMAVFLAEIGLWCRHDMRSVILYRAWTTAPSYCPKEKDCSFLWAAEAYWPHREKWQCVSTMAQGFFNFLQTKNFYVVFYMHKFTNFWRSIVKSTD